MQHTQTHGNHESKTDQAQERQEIKAVSQSTRKANILKQGTMIIYRTYYFKGPGTPIVKDFATKAGQKKHYQNIIKSGGQAGYKDLDSEKLI